MTSADIERTLKSLPAGLATFKEPMECLAVPRLPDGSQWVFEIKLDGYRAIAVKSSGKHNLLSRRRNSFNRQYSLIFEALADLPDNTVIDGEVVALDESGRPDFNLLQHYRAEASRIHYFVFDLLVYKNRDLTRLPLIERHQVMKSVLKLKSPRVRITDYFETSAADMLNAIRAQGLEGVVAKRKDSRYEAGKRSGSWAKYRLNSGQELVIGGYIPGAHGVDAIVVGYYRGQNLIYVARVRNGFVPASRRQVFAKLKPLLISECPFVNLPETHKGRWGEGLTAADMGKCAWVRPKLVARIEFLEWTDSGHLRHSKFAGIREDKDARGVVKEHGGEG
jgi:bifunctional non-homologous end joining protein LigD